MSRSVLTVIVIASLVLFTVPYLHADDAPATQPAKVEPVDYKKLKEIMPDKALGVDRSNLSGENQAIGDYSISNAVADYTKPDSDGSDTNAKITIMDYGAQPEMINGLAVWRTVPIKVENDDGYQRTAKIKGDYPTFETYTKEGESRNMTVVVAERYLVVIEASHASADDFKKFVESLPLDKLAKLK